MEKVINQTNQEEIKKERRRILEGMILELGIYDCGTYFINKFYLRDYQELIKYFPETMEPIQDLKKAFKRLEKEVMGGYNQQLALFICQYLEILNKHHE